MEYEEEVVEVGEGKLQPPATGFLLRSTVDLAAALGQPSSAYTFPLCESYLTASAPQEERAFEEEEPSSAGGRIKDNQVK